MLWEVEIQTTENNYDLQRTRDEYELLRHAQQGCPDAVTVLKETRHGYLLEGELPEPQVRRLTKELLADSVIESAGIRNLQNGSPEEAGKYWTVLLKPGVMDPVSQSVLESAHDIEIAIDSVRTFRRYYLSDSIQGDARKILEKVVANDAIEQILEGPLTIDHLTVGQPYTFQRIVVPLRHLDDDGLMKVSRDGQLALSLEEMKTIQAYFKELNREPTDIELETLAQTWSEHCSHKTLKGKIHFKDREYDNLLKETIFGATQEIRSSLGDEDWCVSVFEDNAGVVKFDDRYNVCFKVETHNHPSAIEPYGGANTGIGGVIRDPLGTGLGAKPICNTDVFCFAPPELDEGETLPPGVLHPNQVMTGVVAGVRDYGNRMGIPTVNGAVCFDKRYLGNPLVYCGTVGLIPIDACHKEPQAGDLIVAVGGRTGRDGIHGATFSSIELTSESEEISGGAVQIGNAITEKKLLDVILQARDRKLYHAITDCGAGGFSSAVGEMGAELGAKVQLDRAPLKYEGLSYTEIWISEAQERMVLAVPSNRWDELKQLCDSEDVEATVIGEFEKTGQLRLLYENEQVGELSMDFLHDGRPDVIREATWTERPRKAPVEVENENYAGTLLEILGSYNVCSKEWIIRQYDHEVQAGTVIKPLVGVQNDGPGDASVIVPVLGSTIGLAVGCGINPHYGDLDPYRMAASAIDEAVRNVVAVGAEPSRIALLDNFCWGNTDRPEVLGSLVLAAEACRDVALAYKMPFISGKDSLKNEFHYGDRHIVIPPTLLISAMGRVPDVRKCVTMDLKAPGNALYLIGDTKDEMGGSHYHLVHGMEGGKAPGPDLQRAPDVFQRLHQAMQRGLVRSCHDLSEGGLAAAIAEVAFAGGVGARVSMTSLQMGLSDAVCLFSESPTRFVLEIEQQHIAAFEKLTEDVPVYRIGETTNESQLQITGRDGTALIALPLADLKEAWQRPLRR